MLLNMVMFKVTICDIGKMNINMTDKIEKKEATFAVPYNGEDNNDYVDGKGFCCNDGSLEAAQSRVMARAMKNNFQEGDTYEKMQFYYHPDHLGSSSYITNLDGEVVQHIEYVPFGEVFIEERNNIWNTPYLFNAKEFDEETGMYYYGARYYESRLSLWMSVDRFAEKYKTSCLEPFEQTQGNCNSSSSTLLYKAGVPLSRIKDLRKQISGLVWGFGDIKPWTVEEQSKAVQRQREFDQLRNEMMNTIILNKY